MPAVVTAAYIEDLLPDFEAEFRKYMASQQYRRDVALWAKHELGVDLWYKQKEIADDLANGDRKSIAVRAGHGVGKSFLAAVIACWWIDTHPIQKVFVASTAPSADQVTTILWREIRRFHSMSHKRYKEFVRLSSLGLDTGDLPDHPLPGYITQQNVWKDDLGNVIGQGRKPPDNKEDAFQGIHDGYVLAIGDEACGLYEQMIDSLSNITSNATSRRLLIGNPTNPRSRFGDIFLDTMPREIDMLDEFGRPVVGDDGKVIKVFVTLQEVWSLHHISVLDSPNFHGGDLCDSSCERRAEHALLPPGLGLTMEALEQLSDQSYVDEKRAEYGDGSARFKARVLGMFAYDAGDNLFTDFEIGHGRDAIAYIDLAVASTVVTLGVDVARSDKGDSTFIYSFTTGLMSVIDDEDGHAIGVSDIQGGALRLVDTYRGVPLVDRIEVDGTHTVGQATLIHQHAVELRASEVRIDSGGLGLGLVDGLYALNWDERRFSTYYLIIEMQGGAASPDSRAHMNNRAFQYDQMSKRMGKGLIDIDPGDKLLIQQLEDILVEFVDPHGAMKIESKVSMKKRGVKSPDAADAAWYACADLSHLQEIQSGDVVRKTADQVILEREEALITSGFRRGSPF